MEISDDNCYTNTESLISKMIIKAINIYDLEFLETRNERQSAARAISETVRSFIKVFSVEIHIDRDMLALAQRSDEILVHYEKQMAKQQVEAILSSDLINKTLIDHIYERRIRYDIALLDFSKIDPLRNTK